MSKDENASNCGSNTDAAELAASYRRSSSDFSVWARGYGVIQHSDFTQIRIHALAERLVASHAAPSLAWVMEKLTAADRLASAAMWLVVHMTYARKVDPSGRPLEAGDFKAAPEGHTGGSLNMVPAYVGYLLANVLTGTTRSWIMGQGHCVAAIEAVNVLVGNLSPARRAAIRDPRKVSRSLATDFYSYAIGPDGRPSAPIGSHVNVTYGRRNLRRRLSRLRRNRICPHAAQGREPSRVLERRCVRRTARQRLVAALVARGR